MAWGSFVSCAKAGTVAATTHVSATPTGNLILAILHLHSEFYLVWWKAASRDEEKAWLCAYYAEFSGDLVVVNAHLKACVTCAGGGRLERVRAVR